MGYTMSEQPVREFEEAALGLERMAREIRQIPSYLHDEMERLREERDAAVEEASRQTAMRVESWREAHVQSRLTEYRRRMDNWSDSLQELIDAIESGEYVTGEQLEAAKVALKDRR